MDKENQFLMSIKNVTKQYGNKTAVKNFNLDIKPGQRIGLIGSNGSGKSTISEIIGGIRKPTKGIIEKDNNLVIGFQFQESKYPHGITVMDMIKYYLQTFKIQITIEDLNEMLNTYQILHLTKKMVHSLSGGQQQRLNILLSVIHKPDLVILDEVSTGLDIEVREEIFEFLQKNIVEKNIAMILVSHTMSEIERFCERIIYMHDGEIIEETTVAAIIKKYGSVHNYTHHQFLKYKKPQQKEIAKQVSLNTKNNNSYVTKTNMRKQTPLLELMSKYYIRGFFVPFFVIVYPILILFLQGFAFDTTSLAQLKNLVGGVAIMQIISIGIFFIPQTIIEFKNSVLMKRIGATNIHPAIFVIAVIIMGAVFALIAFLWTLLWAGIFFGHKYGWNQISLPEQIGASIPWIMIVLASSIGFGMMMASFIKTETAYIAIANIIYLPVAFLSGAIVPMNLIESSSVLKNITYLSPFNYCVKPFMQCWNHQSGISFTFDWKAGLFLGISLALLTTYISVAAWKLKWQE